MHDQDPPQPQPQDESPLNISDDNYNPPTPGSISEDNSEDNNSRDNNNGGDDEPSHDDDGCHDPQGHIKLNEGGQMRDVDSGPDKLRDDDAIGSPDPDFDTGMAQDARGTQLTSPIHTPNTPSSPQSISFSSFLSHTLSLILLIIP